MQNDPGPTFTPTPSLATSRQTREVQTFSETVHSYILTVREAIRFLNHIRPRFFSAYSSQGPILTIESDSDSE